jgi:DNA segregation ATPase FtsK/SpoIIIE, S-DNA-T family
LADQRRSALIIVADSYEDEKLTLLKAPRIDAERLSKLLEGQIVGGRYNVRILANLKGDKIRREIEGFFRNGEKNDLLLLYFSGHGYKSLDDGRFYLVTTDSDLEYTSSMISGAFVNEQMNKSRSINKIFILDCCYSGAFINLTSKGAKTVDINHEFQVDPGTVILTSSTAMQYSFAGRKKMQKLLEFILT